MEKSVGQVIAGTIVSGILALLIPYCLIAILIVPAIMLIARR